jgi:hypothetical protein
MRSNLPLLTRVAQRLNPLLSELVFVGGATTELFFTSPAASEVRMTADADVICEVAGRVEYHRLGERLRTLGFQEDTSPGAPLCRWTSAGGILDVMPVDEDILGFSNPWYERALSTANWVDLPQGPRIRVVSPTMFIATKLAAFEGRGEGDLLGSHDIEDIVVVIAYRDELVPEVGAEPAESRAWIKERIRRHLIDHPDSEYAITGSLPGARVVPGLVPRVLARVQALARVE